MEYTQRLLDAILRTDFRSFLHKVFNTINPHSNYEHNWHIDLISDYLSAVQNGEIRRLIINIPPRSLKSICISAAWPAWLLGHDPSIRIMAASYSQILSIKHSLDCRFIMSSEWYMRIFPKTILSKKHNQKSKFLTTLNGFRFATSVGGSATGEGGDVLIIDDPHNPVHINYLRMRNKVIEWFETTFMTRLNNKNTGAVILVMQRLHEHDLSGYLLSQKSQWKHLKIPVYANRNLYFHVKNKEYLFKSGSTLHISRDKEEHLITLQQSIGMHNYCAQYLQEPIHQNSSLIKLKDIRFYEELPKQFGYFIQSWDSAIKVSANSDYSVCCCFGIIDNYYYLVSMLRQKLTYPELKKNARKLRDSYNPKFILIEDKASGQQLIQDLKLEGLVNIVGIKPKLDKVTRFASILYLFETSRILLPKYSKFTNILLNELLHFPNTKHDDIIDSISQFLNFTKTLQSKLKPQIRTL